MTEKNRKEKLRISNANIELGQINHLKVLRKTDYGFFLDGNTGNSDDDILLHNNNLNGKKVSVGDELDVFVYFDGKNITATLKKPLATVGNIAKLKVVENTDIGTFVDLGIEKDVLVPFREKNYPLFRDEFYTFYIYLDKTNRLAATTDIDAHLTCDSEYRHGDTVDGYVYGFQTNKTAMVSIDNKYAGVILRNEYYKDLKEGDFLNDLKVIKKFEDGKLSLTIRGNRSEEIDEVSEKILSYLEGNDGFMAFNDKSDSEDIRIVFGTSKKNFKRTLGTLMKKGIVEQDENGTKLIK